MSESLLTQQLKQIARGGAQFLALFVFFLYVPLAVYIDIVILGNGMSESSLTEYSQEFLLLMAALAFLWLAYQEAEQRSFALLVGGFFGVLFIRELDGVFDSIRHGAWVYFALAWVAFIAALAMHYKGQCLSAMAQASQSKSFVYIIIGLAVLLGFSRVFGTTRLWQAVLADTENIGLLKNTIQEGLELLGYQLIFIGSASYLWQARKSVKAVSKCKFSSLPV